MRGRWWAIGVLVGFGALAAVPFALGREAATARVTETLQLNAKLDLVSIRAASCPPGTGPGILCPGRTGKGLVPGLGSVSESYSYMAEEAPASCPAGSAKILGYPVRWIVAGKGEIHFALHEPTDCLNTGTAFTADQSFTITGGTGIYAGASGSGRADRELTQTAEGARGPERWTGTLTVAGLEFDLARPTIGGVRPRTVRAPRKAKRVRVSYIVTASDATDGSVSVACRPPSGSWFRVGRTTVRCSATDESGNTATATFVVTVRRR